jgi:hypothetical protein
MAWGRGSAGAKPVGGLGRGRGARFGLGHGSAARADAGGLGHGMGVCNAEARKSLDLEID